MNRYFVPIDSLYIKIAIFKNGEENGYIYATEGNHGWRCSLSAVLKYSEHWREITRYEAFLLL